MSHARLIFNVEHDAAAVAWDHRPTDMPLDPLNFALAKFYEAQLHPFVYIAYDDVDVSRGLLIAESMELTSPEIHGLFQQIIDAHDAAPQTDTWAMQEFVV